MVVAFVAVVGTVAGFDPHCCCDGIALAVAVGVATIVDAVGALDVIDVDSIDSIAVVFLESLM